MSNKPLISHFSILLALAILVASLPLGLLHHHELQNGCHSSNEVTITYNSGIDQKITHLHEKSDDCYFCLKSHQLQYVLFVENEATKIDQIDTPFSSPKLLKHIIIEIDIQGRAPPICS